MADDKMPPAPVLVDETSGEDFVSPPLPPPPSVEDLASFGGSLSGSQKTESPPPIPTVVSPTYKASANFSVWSPGGNRKSSQDGGQVEVGSKSTANTGPTGFRSVRPMLKKSDKSPAPSTVTTSYNFPESRTTLPEQSANVKITPKNQLPNGAVYETKTVDGDMVHTDTYYPAADGGTVLERTKKTTVVKAEHHRGMGPTDNQGVPIALRSTVDNPKAWYKNMFKQIHKVEQEDENDFTQNDHPPEENHKPIVSNAPAYRPKRLGRITDYTPSEPYVVESKPNGNRIPPASTSYNPPRNHQQKAAAVKTDRVEPVHGTEYEVKDLPLADHVVIEPKHVVVMNTSKSKEPKREEGRRQNARAKFDFVAQSSKQLGFKKDQIIVITKTINKDWYEGETPDRKSSGMFPVSYVEVLGEAEKRAKKKGAAKAKFDFAGTNPKQLSIQKGDSLELIEKVDKNWYKAAIGRRTGIVPSNYIEVISEPETAGPKSTAAPVPKVKSPVSKEAPNRFAGQGPVSPPPSGDPEDKAKITRAAFLANEVVNSGAKLSKPRPSQGEYDIPELTDAALGFQSETDGKRASQVSTVSSSGSSNQAEDPAKLTAYGTHAATSVDARVNASVAKADASASTSVDASDDFPVLREKFVAIYRYDPQNEDELELAPGDAVQVVEKCDDGWFVGTCERTGAFGTFPGNYVTIA